MSQQMLVNLGAEKAVLGSVLIDPAAIHRVGDLVTPDDFHDERHRSILGAMQRLRASGLAVDFVSLTPKLQEQGELNKAGGPAYVTSLINATPTSVHLEHYAAIVSRLAVLRRLMAVTGKIAGAAHNPDAELGEVFGLARRLIDSVAPLALGDAVLAWQDSLGAWLGGQAEREEERRAELAGDRAGRVQLPW